METKLILSDLDETLLHSDKTISDYSARIFEQCRQRGILVGFCTSRGKANIIPFENKINPDICICNGGASIYQNGTLLHATSFSIMFKKQFFTILPDEHTNERIVDILNIRGLSDRIITENTDIKTSLDKIIDYSALTDYDIQIKASGEYLERALRE